MTDRYWRVNRNLGYGCRECGVHVSHVDLHDAFHDRFDRIHDAIPARMTPPEPDPESPFPVGAKVRSVNSGSVYTVSGWVDHDAYGWCVETLDNGMRRYWPQGARPDNWERAYALELVPEPDPLVCAVCGEPVLMAGPLADRPVHFITNHSTRTHAATLTAPEPAETYQADTEPPVGSVVRCEGCGNVFVHQTCGWLDTDRCIGTTWKAMQSGEFCDPLTVIYTGGGR